MNTGYLCPSFGRWGRPMIRGRSSPPGRCVSMAMTARVSQKQRVTRMGFQKGKPKTGGRQLGQPNKVSLEIKAHARAVVEDPTYQAKLKERLLEGSAPQLEVLLHYYAY